MEGILVSLLPIRSQRQQATYKSSVVLFKNMLSEMLWVFQKNWFIKKIVNSQKIKSVKNFIIKKSATKTFQICISIVYDRFILELSISISISTALLLWDNVKCGLLSKHLFQRKRQYDGWRNFTVTTNF